MFFKIELLHIAPLNIFMHMNFSKFSLTEGAGTYCIVEKGGAYITHNATYLVSDIKGGSLSDYMKLPLEPLKASYYLFYIYTNTPLDL